MGIHSSQQLKQRISELNILVKEQEGELKEEYTRVFELLKPSSLIRYTIREISNSPETIDSIAAMSAGIGAGMAARNIISGNSDSFFRKFAGSLAEIGANNIVSKNYPAIKTYFRELLQPILKHKN